MRRVQAPQSAEIAESYAHSLLLALQPVLNDAVIESFRPLRSHATWSHQALSLVAIFMAWSESSRLVDRFEVAREAVLALGPQFQNIGKTYRGFSKMLARVPESGTKALINDLRRQIQEVGGEQFRIAGWVAIAVDGSKFNLPRTRANIDEFGDAGKHGSSPQTLLTLLWHMGLGIPWEWTIDRGRGSERSHLATMLNETPPDTLFVGDAGYMGYEMLQSIIKSGRSFLIRAAGNADLLRKLGYWEREGKDTVYLWPNDKRDVAPIPLRLITVKRKVASESGKKLKHARYETVNLVTNVMDRAALTCQDAKLLYHRRWGIELQYRAIKQVSERDKVLSKNPDYARAELEWTMIATMVQGLMMARAMAAGMLDFARSSCAGFLRRMRRAIRRAQYAPTDVLTELQGAVKDTYKRKSPKTRDHWPTQRRRDPLQPPNIRDATTAEVKLAREVAQIV